MPVTARVPASTEAPVTVAGAWSLHPSTGTVVGAVVAVVAVSATWTMVLPALGLGLAPVTVEQVHGLLNTTLQVSGAVVLFRGAAWLQGRRRLAWTTMAIGATCGAVGSVAWSVILAATGRHPNSPLVDGLYATALFLTTVGVAVLPPSQQRSRRIRAVDTAILMLTALTLVWVTPLHQQVDGRLIAGFATVDVFAVVTTVTIVVAVGAVARCLPDLHGEVLPMSGALTCSGVAMLLYASAPDGYSTASRVADLVFAVGFVFAITAGLRLRGPGRPPRRRGTDGARHWIALPEVATVATLVAITVHERSTDNTLASLVVGSVAVALAIARLLQLGMEQQRLSRSLHDSADLLYREARTDTLTHLGNRLALDEHLRTLLARRARTPLEDREPVSVFFIDVDHFKRFNDALGHAVGDGLLVEVADRIVATVGDHAYRNGGDEFVAVVQDADGDRAREIASQLIARFEPPVAVDDHEMSASVSVGVATWDSPDQPGSADDLLRRADLALYRAKELGRATWAAFEPSVARLAEMRHQLREGLQEAADADLLSVRFQPVARLQGLRLVGATADLWLDSPTLGRLGSEVIGPAAVEGGLVATTTAALFREVRRTLVDTAHVRTDAIGTPLWLGVRLSEEELVHPAVIELVSALVEDPEVDASRLHVEVVEATIVDDAALEVITRLGQLGVQLTVERFGTGPTSLLRLDHYPATTLCVDGTFVHGLGRRREDTVIVTAVAGLAAELGLGLCADGIDEEFQATYLEGLGFSTGRGRLIGETIERAQLLTGRLDLPDTDRLAAELSR